MIKKLLVAAISVTIIFSSFTSVYADKNILRVSKDKTVVFDIKNLENTRTFEKRQVISGTARQGTYVALSLHWLMSAQDTSIISNRSKEVSDDVQSGEWIEYDEKDWTVGQSGIFAESVKLKFGKNKLVFDIQDKEGNKETKEIFIEVNNRKQVEDVISNMVIGNIEKDLIK